MFSRKKQPAEEVQAAFLALIRCGACNFLMFETRKDHDKFGMAVMAAYQVPPRYQCSHEPGVCAHCWRRGAFGKLTQKATELERN